MYTLCLKNSSNNYFSKAANKREEKRHLTAILLKTQLAKT